MPLSPVVPVAAAPAAAPAPGSAPAGNPLGFAGPGDPPGPPPAAVPAPGSLAAGPPVAGAAPAPVSLINADGSYAENWLTRLGVSEEVQADQQLLTHKGLADTVTNLHELMKIRGDQVIPVPPDSAAPDDPRFALIAKRLGCPEKATDYKVPDFAASGLAPEHRMPDETMGAVLGVLHKAGVTQRQLDQVIPGWNAIVGAGLKASAEASEAALAPLQAEVASAQAYIRSNVEASECEASLAALSDPGLVKLIAQVAKASAESEPATPGIPGSSSLAIAQTEVQKLIGGGAQGPYLDKYNPDHVATVARVNELRAWIAANTPAKTSE